MGSQRVRHDWVTWLDFTSECGEEKHKLIWFLFHFHLWEISLYGLTFTPLTGKLNKISKIRFWSLSLTGTLRVQSLRDSEQLSEPCVPLPFSLESFPDCDAESGNPRGAWSPHSAEEPIRVQQGCRGRNSWSSSPDRKELYGGAPEISMGPPLHIWLNMKLQTQSSTLQSQRKGNRCMAAKRAAPRPARSGTVSDWPVEGGRPCLAPDRLPETEVKTRNVVEFRPGNGGQWVRSAGRAEVEVGEPHLGFLLRRDAVH